MGFYSAFKGLSKVSFQCYFLLFLTYPGDNVRKVNLYPAKVENMVSS